MPTPNAPLPEAAVARFRGDLEALIPTGAPLRILGIGVSGGPDSLALLLLAHFLLPGRVRAATVDHGLRPEAAAEAGIVAGICRNLGIPHAILSKTQGVAPGNTQEQARILRYRLLGAWAQRENIGHIAVAHHADDVAETFLMRALRGAGVTGLARMATSGPVPYQENAEVVLLRPVLSWRRSDLGMIAANSGIESIQDPSNRDDRYDRVRVRRLLADEPKLDVVSLARAAANLADAETALEWMTEQAWRSRATLEKEGGIRLDAIDLPYDLRRRLAARAIYRLSKTWNGEGIDSLLDGLSTASAATLSDVQATGEDAGTWYFRIAPPRRGRR